jgi:hypothetical protein
MNMNKLIWFIVLALLLCGCGVPEQHDDNLPVVIVPEPDCKPKKDKSPEETPEPESEECSN